MREIPLANGRGVALVDDEDYERLAVHSWYLLSGAYASRTANDKENPMHREVLGYPDAPHVDHIDGNGLNNQKRNLRPCRPIENMRNRRAGRGRRFKGVTRRTGFVRWHAEISLSGRSHHLGTFDTPEEAARAYDAAAREHFGEFARLNFPNVGEQPALI